MAGEVCLADFEVLSKLGEGGFGRVVLARKRAEGAPRRRGRSLSAEVARARGRRPRAEGRDAGTVHALKAIFKQRVLRAGQQAVRHALDENHILQSLKHPFIVTLQYAFQDESRLYLVTNWVGGGDLEKWMRKRPLGEAACQFYAAQLALARNATVTVCHSRTADLAAHWLDHMLPDVPIRQWVLTLPWPLRYRLAWDPDLLADVLAVYLRVLFRWQQLRARRIGSKAVQSGAITAIQLNTPRCSG